MNIKALEEEHERLMNELANVEIEIEKAQIEYMCSLNKNASYDIRSVVNEQPIMDPDMLEASKKYIKWVSTPQPPPIVVTMEFDTETLFKDNK